jgi:uncharacterized membrane protein
MTLLSKLSEQVVAYRGENTMIDSMINAFYGFLNSLGYSHPVHPTIVHMTIGLVVAALIFSWVAFLFKKKQLYQTARYCSILAFLFWFPVVFFGLTDWLHFFNGAWLYEIEVKFILAGILLVLLAIGLFVGSKGRQGSKLLLVLYTLSFFTVVGLGYFGAQLVYTSKAQATPQTYKAGEQIFLASCSGCHPHGGNVIKPTVPVINAPKMRDLKTFVAYLRHPIAPMPAFNASQISDQQAEELYQYIVKVLEKQKGQ